jgi:hypothetical protein
VTKLSKSQVSVMAAELDELVTSLGLARPTSSPVRAQGAPVCPQLDGPGCGYPAIGCLALGAKVKLGSNSASPLSVRG